MVKKLSMTYNLITLALMASNFVVAYPRYDVRGAFMDTGKGWNILHLLTRASMSRNHHYMAFCIYHTAKKAVENELQKLRQKPPAMQIKSNEALHTPLITSMVEE
jgi:hypothetical protein